VIERRRGDSQIDIHVLLGELAEDNSSVLGETSLRDVQVAHDLDTGNNGRIHLGGKAQLSPTDTINSIAND